MSTNEEVFKELKEACIRCMNEANEESIKELNELILRCDQKFVNSLNHFLVFPLRFIIENLPQETLNYEKILESSIECLSLIASKSTIIKFEFFSDLFMVLMKVIDPNTNDENNDKNSFTKRSEDLILSGVRCFRTLLASCHNTLCKEFVSASFRPLLGHSIHCLLRISLTESYHILKYEALVAIEDMINKLYLIEAEDKGRAADVLAFFLPGISANIMKVITCDDKTKRNVLTASLSVLSQTIVFVFNESHNNLEEDNKQVNDNRNEFMVKRDSEWVQLTCEKLCIIFKKIISSLMAHQNMRVRLSLAQFAINLLTKCSPLFINNCLLVLLKVPLTLLYDDYNEIVSVCDKFMIHFSANYINNESINSCMDLIQEEAYTYLLTLPRLMRTQNTHEKLASINLLLGFFKCFDSQGINNFLYSTEHKQRLFQCLIEVAEFDYKGVHLLEEIQEADDLLINHNNNHLKRYTFYQKNFMHLNEQNLIDAMRNCCAFIGINGETLLLTDYLLNGFGHIKLNPSFIFISNSIIEHINGSYNIVSEILDDYLLSLNNLSTIKFSSRQVQTIEQMNKEVLNACLLIEGISLFVKLSDSTSSHHYLQKCLCPLLQHAGSSNMNVSLAANKGLDLVSNHLGYNSVSSLLQSNVDYIVNTIYIKLRHFYENQNITAVIIMMFKHSDEKMLKYYLDLVDEILIVIDSHHHTHALPLIVVLTKFIYMLRSWHLLETNTNNSAKVSDDRICLQKRAQNVFREFQEYLSNKQVASTLEVDSNTEIDNENEDTNDSTPCPPPYIKTIESILEKCVHLISINDANVRLATLDLILQTLPLIKHFEDSSLPLIHKIWSPLVARFQDTDILVIKRAFLCLLSISETCGDFIRHRTLKEVLPKILSFLKSQAKQSYKKDKSFAYKITIGFKIQLDVLYGIGQLAFNLDLRDKDLWPIIIEIIPYCSIYHPTELQEAALSALKKLSEVDLSAVLYYVLMTFSHNPFISHDEHKTFSCLSLSCDAKKEYEKNLTKLLKDIKFL